MRPTAAAKEVRSALNAIPLLVPQLPDARALLPYLRQIDRNHWYSNFGPLVRQLEARIGASFADAGARGVAIVTVSNATAGLELALRALGLPANAYVLVPAFTFVATATAVLSAGLTPICADVDASTWQLSPEIAEAACKVADISAVLPVCVFGQSVSTGAWDAFHTRTGIPVVIDAAAAFGNLLDPGPTCAVFSMHATKPLSAGEGGFVATRSPVFAEAITQLSNFGINLTRPNVAPIGVSTTIGINAKLSEYHAAVGLASLDVWPQTVARRKGLFVEYKEIMERRCGNSVRFQDAPADAIRSVLAFVSGDGRTRSNIEAALATRKIGTRRWYCPTVDQHPAFAHIDHLPIITAHEIGDRVVGIPFHLFLDKVAMERVAGAIRAGLT